ncbi:hypothetical protein pb186bvf_005178 [Paramecium bursaria]
MGLSSYHGRITYIKKGMTFWQTLTTIIHEFAHNISRFLMKKKKNQEFQQQEAGNFLEQKLFRTDDHGQSPLGLKQF